MWDSARGGTVVQLRFGGATSTGRGHVVVQYAQMRNGELSRTYSSLDSRVVHPLLVSGALDPSQLNCASDTAASGAPAVGDHPPTEPASYTANMGAK